MKKNIRKTMLKVSNGVNGFMSEEKGEVNLIAILLIILVTIGLVIIFRTQITNLINNIFTKINQNINGM